MYAVVCLVGASGQVCCLLLEAPLKKNKEETKKVVLCQAASRMASRPYQKASHRPFGAFCNRFRLPKRGGEGRLCSTGDAIKA